MHILGLSRYFHDAAACLLRDGEIVAAASEKRFSRKKHDQDFPVRAIRYCLDQGEIGVDELDHVAFYDKPLRKFDRILTTCLATLPKSRQAFSRAMPVWLKQKLRVRDLFREELGWEGPVIFGRHHLSHAASAFLASPFQEAAILTLDGVGESDTAAFDVGRGSEITLTNELRYPHSLGLLYSAFTYYLGARVNSGEYKVMGLAPYGQPRYVDRIMELLDRLCMAGGWR